MVDGGTPETAHYNDVYERLVDASDPDVSDIRGWIAYGKYKREKKQWCERLWRDHRRTPTAEDLTHWRSTLGQAHIDGLLEQADKTIEDYTLHIITEARPEIVEEALRGKLWTDVGIAMLAAALYTLALGAVVIIVKLAGYDLLHVYENLGALGAPH